MYFLRRAFFCLSALIAALPLNAQTTPALLQPLPAQGLAISSGAVTVDLKKYFALPGVTGQVAQVETSFGIFNVELLAADAPKTVTNFLGYVDRGAYQNGIFHRSVPGFVIQTGGYTLSGNSLVTVPAAAPVQNEFKNSNVRGTLAMAKLGGDPNSATSQWFINLADNSANLDNQNGGFTVFARVLGTGMSVADAIASVPYYDASSQLGGDFTNLPLLDSSIQPGNFVLVKSIKIIPVYPDATSDKSVLSFVANASITGIADVAVTNSQLTLTPVAVGTTTITVTVTDTNGNSTTGLIPVTVVVGEGPPTILAHPQPLVAMAAGTTNNTVVFSVVAVGAPAPNYQWRRNGVAVTGQRSSTYVLTNASSAQAGNFTCVVSNSHGSVESLPGVLTFVPAANPSRLVNLSVLTALTAGESMTMGTVLGGAGTSGNKALLVRAAGPSLTQFGVTSVLPDPTMTLNSTSVSPAVVVATNNDWGGTASLSNAFAQFGAFAYAATNSKDAALFQSSATALAPGNYTVQVKDTGSGNGSVIAELYDATPSGSFTAATPRLVNVSVLKQIAAGGTLTAGFVIAGPTSRTVLVRAIGPGLTQFGVSGVMVDPQLTLFNDASKVAENDNWGGDPQLTTVGNAVGAFPVSNAASKDAMLVMTLGPGNYTAQVSGIGGSGSALVEVYEVP